MFGSCTPWSLSLPALVLQLSNKITNTEPPMPCRISRPVVLPCDPQMGFRRRIPPNYLAAFLHVFYSHSVDEDLIPKYIVLVISRVLFLWEGLQHKMGWQDKLHQGGNHVAFLQAIVPLALRTSAIPCRIVIQALQNSDWQRSRYTSGTRLL